MNTPPFSHDLTDILFLKVAYLLPSLDMSPKLLEEHRTVLEKASSFYLLSEEEINLLNPLAGAKDDSDFGQSSGCATLSFPWGGPQERSPKAVGDAVGENASGPLLPSEMASGETFSGQHHPSKPSSELELRAGSQKQPPSEKPLTVVDRMNDHYVDPFQDHENGPVESLTLNAFRIKWAAIRATLEREQSQTREMDLNTIKQRVEVLWRQQQQLSDQYRSLSEAFPYLTHKQWMKTIFLMHKLRIEPKDLIQENWTKMKWWRDWSDTPKQKEDRQEYRNNVEHIQLHLKQQNSFALKRGLVDLPLPSWNQVSKDLKNLEDKLEPFTNEAVRLQRRVAEETRNYRRSKSESYRQKQQRLGVKEIDRMMETFEPWAQDQPHILMAMDGFMQLMLKKEDIHWKKRKIIKRAIEQMPPDYREQLMNLEPGLATAAPLPAL